MASYPGDETGEKLREKWACRHEDLGEDAPLSEKEIGEFYNWESVAKAVGKLKQGSGVWT